ncbi:hypothetical protein [Bartonella sp. B1098]|uniref:hypothetical protein n=1 Tax=Bartonella sp. B1098 TaxID=2911421 RepID=UPI0020C52847|nr:hypothetical protein [Bartonella sp. B1098]
MEKGSWFNNISRFFIPPDQGEHPLVRMSRIGADGLISPHLPPTVQRAKNKWSVVQEERERQKHEEIYGRKLLGMIIPKIGERPVDKMNMLQKVIEQHQGPIVPSAISLNQPFNTGDLSSVNVGSIIPDGIYHEKKEPYMVPEVKIPLGVGDHSPLPNAQEFNQLTPIIEEATSTPQSQASPVDTRTGFEKFVQSDFYKKLQDLFSGMSAAPSGGSGWDALASGVKHLNEGDKQRGQVNQTVEYLKSKGYSEEEAAVMARNPQMLNALLTGGKTPEGFQSYTNPETGELEYRPVKGSMQELEYNQKKKEIEEWEINKRNAAAIAAKEIDNIMGTVNDALKLIDENPDKVAGIIGSLALLVPGSDANSLKKKFKQLEGGIFTRVIETIKKQSENGSLGVGPLSNEESARLVASYGSLDISDKPEELHKTLLKIKDMFDLFKQLNDEEIYRLSKGMEVRPRSNPSAQYSNQSISQGGGANLPTISSREELYNYPPGTVVDYNGTPVYREAKR